MTSQPDKKGKNDLLSPDSVVLYRQISKAEKVGGLRKKMKPVASAMDMKRVSEKIMKKKMRASQSMPDFRDPLRSVLRSVPFYAIHGMSAHVRRLSRTFSRSSFGTSAGTTMDGEIDPMLSDALESQGYTSRLVLVVFSVLMGAINFGYNTSVLNTPEHVIRSSLTHNSWVDDFSWAIIVSIFCIGGLIGSSIAPILLDTIGRKGFLLYNGIFLTFVLLFESLSISVMMMALSRLLIGISCGGTTVAVPLYLGEIAPVGLRGSLGTLNQFAMVVGILLAQILGKPLGYDPGWRVLLAIGAVFSSLQVLLSPFVVESPRWLVMQGENKKAKELLILLRNEREDSSIIKLELESMMEVSEQEKKEISVGILVRNPKLRLPFMIGIALMLFQQFSGINAVFYYSTGFFASAHFTDPYLGTVLAGAVNVVATGFAVELMDRAGRKPLLILSSIGMTISSCLLTFALVASPILDVDMGYLEVVGVMLYVAFFEFGLGPIPWAITAELFGSIERATAMGACSCINWVASFLIGLLFPALNQLLKSYSFVPFAVMTLLAAIFSYAVVPETKGKTLPEIQESMFSGGNAKKGGAMSDAAADIDYEDPPEINGVKFEVY
mmetsp:Transcript_25050/g.34900  ORF Transcript_25050/g.34900 Transcript_25050/m.34900 type:complete len:610 (+) Transcript_25050:254-2083(+)|eukprot:CAMPEP_0184490128 /NCGR_PEP_ID=MMETSP0113_2-20130426/17191_1 /TAXON_ID=91329 /ORGANISM="Norrisiella sphaerica, Strain BC52" /LENGTH=609 /DNA_ID=CAMNT_0026873887 /DNA_START=168 /DNA_END=1997 /DNA_ORIENTATION=+